jgi:hypothetical protein
MRRDQGAWLALGAMGALVAASAAGRRGGGNLEASPEIRRLPFRVFYTIIDRSLPQGEQSIEMGAISALYLEEEIRLDNLSAQDLEAAFTRHGFLLEAEELDDNSAARELGVLRAWRAGEIQIPTLARLVAEFSEVALNLLPDTPLKCEGGVLAEAGGSPYGDSDSSLVLIRELQPVPDVRRKLGGRKLEVPWPAWILPYIEAKTRPEPTPGDRERIERGDATMLGVTVSKLRELRER